MSVILMDNFSGLDIVRASGQMDTTWLKERYTVAPAANRYSELRISTAADGRPELTRRNSGVATTYLPYVVGKGLPQEFSRFCIGFRVSYVALTNSPSQVGASFGVVELDGDTVKPVLLFVLHNNRTAVHYCDETGQPATRNLPILAVGNYLDFTIDKVSNQPNELSNLIVSINNSPVLSGAFFNNAGTKLTAMIMGTVPANLPTTGDGFLGSLDLATAPSHFSNSYLGIQDLYVSKDGKRFGNPRVNRYQAQSITTDLVPNTAKTAVQTLNQVPNVWEYIDGLGQAAITTNAPDNARLPAQITAYAYTNTDAATTTSVASGAANASVQNTPGPKMVTAITTSRPQSNVGVTDG